MQVGWIRLQVIGNAFTGHFLLLHVWLEMHVCWTERNRLQGAVLACTFARHFSLLHVFSRRLVAVANSDNASSMSMSMSMSMKYLYSAKSRWSNLRRWRVSD